MKTCLLIIDPQKDFANPSGALYVTGAESDSERLAKVITDGWKSINEIKVTQDSHHQLHVAHKWIWRNSKGEMPDPFTIITENDIKSGKWLPVRTEWTNKMLEYVQKLEQNGRYALCIWPDHCLIGSYGWTIQDDVYKALNYWEQQKMPAFVDYITKGSNIWCEHYSAVKADVPDSGDLSTEINMDLIKALKTYDLIALAGWASSHCLLWTGRDIVDNFGADQVKKLCLLEDCTSPVGGFEQQANDGLQELYNKGMQVATGEQFLKMI